MLAAKPLNADSAPYTRRSCCYTPVILEMLQADLVIICWVFSNLLLDNMLVFLFCAFLIYLLLDMLVFFVLCKSALFSASRMGKSLLLLQMHQMPPDHLPHKTPLNNRRFSEQKAMYFYLCSVFPTHPPRRRPKSKQLVFNRLMLGS